LIRTHRHWQALLGAALLALACGGAAAQGLAREEVGAMQRVIDAQLDAFARDDEQGAFAFASPGIQELTYNDTIQRFCIFLIFFEIFMPVSKCDQNAGHDCS
jgi:hypothetical protein